MRKLELKCRRERNLLLGKRLRVEKTEGAEDLFWKRLSKERTVRQKDRRFDDVWVKSPEEKRHENKDWGQKNVAKKIRGKTSGRDRGEQTVAKIQRVKDRFEKNGEKKPLRKDRG